MRRGYSHTAVDADDPQGHSRAEAEHELLSFQSAPSLVSTSYQHRPAAAFSLQYRSSSAGLADKSPTLSHAQSPLLDRRRSDRTVPDVLSYSAGMRISPTTAELAVRASTSAAASLTGVGLSTASPFTPLAYPFGRPLSTEPVVTATPCGSSTRRHENSSIVVESPVAPRANASYLGPESSLPHYSNTGGVAPHRFTAVNTAAAATQSLAPPPSSSSSWRTVRLVLSAFCLLNGVLAFVFAWMMRTRQAAFAVVSVHRGWDLDEKAIPMRLAGVYYVVLGLILLVDRASATVAQVVRAVGHTVRAGCSKGRHTIRRYAVRATTVPLFAPMMRLWEPKVSDDQETAFLLGVDVVVEPGCAPPAPLKIRRRGN